MPNPQAAGGAAIEPVAGLWSPERRGLTLGLVLTITLVAAEALAVPTAMPIVARDLGGQELYGLVFTAFSVGALIGIVAVGALIDMEGVVRPFVGGLALFGIGLLIGGLAPSMPVLIAARFIQGIGGGAIPPVAYVAIGRAMPASLRPRMFAYLSTAWILPGVFGPAIAGFVAQELHWRLVFLGLLPLIALPGGLATRALIEVHEAHPPFRAGGSISRRIGLAVGVAVGVVLVTAGLESPEPELTLGLGVVGLVVIGAFFKSLAPPGTMTLARGFPTAVLLRGVLTFAWFCVDAYVSLLLVDVRGWSATAAGIALTAATLSWTGGSWVQARLSHRYRPEQFVRVGFPIVALGLAGMWLVLQPSIPAELAVPIFGIGGFGMGLTYSQFALIVLRDVPPAEQGTVTAGLTLSDTLGTALGLGVSAAIVAASYRAGQGYVPGLALAFILGSVAAVVGLVISPRLVVRARPRTAGAPEALG
ncbi:MAG TPA: MFS transporter [Candidatus Limnocylindrales bacterium]